ncbi:MAG: efflux RND transporter permease subunit [Desulfobacterales bacterium]|nr:efflux RND transporter permease subunit [Desulfobacterales bacterium]
MQLTATTLKRPVAAVVLTIAIVITGLFSFTQLEVDYLPEVTYPMIKIHIWWQGATPEEIETEIAEPIEEVLATVDNLDYLESSSIEGMYTLLVNFEYGVDVEVAYQDVITAMGRVSRRLPKSMDPPVIIKADPSQLPVMQMTVSSDQHDLVWLREWADNWLSDRLITVPGTAGVEIVGGLEREIRVHLDPQRMAAFGLSPARVAGALSAGNRQIFAGRVTVENREIIARTMGEFESIAEIENLVVANDDNGGKVYVKDVAQVEDSHEDMRVNTRFNGEPAIKLNVLKQSTANTVTVAAAVQDTMEGLEASMPSGIRIGYVENQGDYVLGAIHSVENSAILAAILVIVVVYLFLGRWRQVAVMMIALPATLLANFFVMKTAGFSINLFSLGGLVVALGVILDNSVVVLENITRLKAEGKADYTLAGTREVGSAIVAATLTFLAIFLPFLFVPGLAALLFKELVLVVAGIVIISLLVALTLTPLLTQSFLRGEKSTQGSKAARAFDAVLSALTRKYARLLQKCLQGRWIIISAALVLFAGGLLLANLTGSEFLPKVDDGRVMVKLKMPSGTAVEKVDRILKQVEKKLEGLPEIESTFTLAGGKVWGLYTYEIANEGEVDIQLVPGAERDVSTRQFISKIKPMVAQIPTPGGKLMVKQMKVKGIRQVGEQEVEVKIQGSEIKPIFDFAKTAAARLEDVSGLGNINVSMDMTKPEYRVHIDRARASELGVSVDHVADMLQTLVQGRVATRYREGMEYYNIRLVVPEKRLTSKRDLENLVVADKNGESIYLRDLADVRRASGPVEIVRENLAKQVIVRADSAGISVGEAVSRAEQAMAGLEAPSGVGWEMGGQAQMMAENTKAMGLILAFAVLFAYVALAIQFESFVLPMLVMANVPLTLTGAFLALFITATPIGVTVLIGLVVMMGGITSQGVVLLALAEQYRAEGAPARQAIEKAAPIRVRPILMTQLTTVLGLLPLALNLGEGGDMLVPMAIAVIGGLLYSLLLTLFFLPAAYGLAMGRRDAAGVAQQAVDPNNKAQTIQQDRGQTCTND